MFFSIKSLDKYRATFNFVLGGRGTGKTYGAFKTMLEKNVRFIYMRRTQTELDLISGGDALGDLNPFRQINKDLNREIGFEKINKSVYGIFDFGNDKKLIGYALALSTVCNLRGFDASDVEIIIFDEFIPETHARPIKNEATAFFNAYETVNRNREFASPQRPPVIVYLLANSNNIANPIMMETGITKKLERMLLKNKKFMKLDDMSVTVTIIDDAELKEKKSKSALYKLTKNSKFSEMSLENKFAFNDFTGVAVKPIIEFKPFCAIKNVYIYKHKSRNEYYATRNKHNINTYGDCEQAVRSFNANYGRLIYGAYLTKTINYEDIGVKEELLSLIL